MAFFKKKQAPQSAEELAKAQLEAKNAKNKECTLKTE